MTQPRSLLLASSSPHRRALLERLRLPFRWAAPAIDEARLPAESTQDLVARLSVAKARALARSYAGYLIVGSDQAAALDGNVLGKPGNFEAAFAQLKRQSEREVRFYTGVTVLDTDRDRLLTEVDVTEVRFRRLTDGEIRRYLKWETPFDCAGSFKCEGLGIALFDRICTEDPTALMGLPLIQTASLLRQFNLEIP